MLEISTMNLELTDKCPLHCPQCYCDLLGRKNMELNTAFHWLKEAANHSCKTVSLSGGETMLYPHLFEVISYAKGIGITPSAAFSGVGFTEKKLLELIASGIDRIHVSLNGSTEEINNKTRDGYSCAISALELLHEHQYPNIGINWVMQDNNSDDFPNIVKIAEKFRVKFIQIISLKPNNNADLKSVPTLSQMTQLAEYIRKYKGPVLLNVEICYPALRAMVLDYGWLGIISPQSFGGCIAGQKAFSVNVDGKLSPCRHLDYFEEWDTLEEYWTQSPILKKIREVEEHRREPCTSCKYCNCCRHCLAINSKINGDIYIGNSFCQLAGE